MLKTGGESVIQINQPTSQQTNQDKKVMLPGTSPLVMAQGKQIRKKTRQTHTAPSFNLTSTRSDLQAGKNGGSII